MPLTGRGPFTVVITLQTNIVIMSRLMRPPVKALLPCCDGVRGWCKAGVGCPGSLVAAGTVVPGVGPPACSPATGPLHVGRGARVRSQNNDRLWACRAAGRLQYQPRARVLVGAAGRRASTVVITPPNSSIMNMTREMKPPVRPWRLGGGCRGGAGDDCDEPLPGADGLVPGAGLPTGSPAGGPEIAMF